LGGNVEAEIFSADAKRSRKREAAELRMIRWVVVGRKFNREPEREVGVFSLLRKEGCGSAI
jgi:hypothetical protein